MRVIETLNNLPAEATHAVVVIGNFDGVHIGHQALLSRAAEIAKDKNFLARINEARRIGAQTYIENAMSELETADNRNIMVVREKVQLAKWMASKLIPIYGDKQEIKQETKIEIQWSTPDNKVVDVTPDEIGITEQK